MGLSLMCCGPGPKLGLGRAQWLNGKHGYKLKFGELCTSSSLFFLEGGHGLQTFILHLHTLLAASPLARRAR